MGMPAPSHRYTLGDYLDVEESSEVRHEYYDGRIYAMAGGTPEHAALSAAILVLIGPQLRGGTCRVFGSDLRIRILPTGLATYPDAAVICGEPERDPDSPTHITNPAAVFEVLSPSTEGYDRGDKREHYQQLDSLRDYLLVAQDQRKVERWRRGATGWEHEVRGPGETLTLESLGCTLAIDELYDQAGIP